MLGDRVVEVDLERDGRRLPPDLRVRTADRVHAVWYDLEPGDAALRAESAERFGVRRPLTLTAGRIDRVVCDLEPLPSLEVALDLPQELREGDLALELRLLPGGELLERRPLPRDAEASLFELLPPEVWRSGSAPASASSPSRPTSDPERTLGSCWRPTSSRSKARSSTAKGGGRRGSR
jgi:hypothetical protein